MSFCWFSVPIPGPVSITLNRAVFMLTVRLFGMLRLCAIARSVEIAGVFVGGLDVSRAGPGLPLPDFAFRRCK